MQMVDKFTLWTSHCKHIHLQVAIVIAAVSWVVIVIIESSLLAPAFFILFIRIFGKFIHAMIRRFRFWARIVFSIVFCLLFATAPRLIKSSNCGLNCLACFSLSVLTAMNNSSYFWQPSIDHPLPPPFVCFPFRREYVYNGNCDYKHKQNNNLVQTWRA